MKTKSRLYSEASSTLTNLNKNPSRTTRQTSFLSDLPTPSIKHELMLNSIIDGDNLTFSNSSISEKHGSF